MTVDDLSSWGFSLWPLSRRDGMGIKFFLLFLYVYLITGREAKYNLKTRCVVSPLQLLWFGLFSRGLIFTFNILRELRENKTTANIQLDPIHTLLDCELRIVMSVIITVPCYYV